MSSDRLTWRRARRCVSEDNCVEVADGDQLVGVRNSQLPGVRLEFPVAAWGAFVAAVRSGHFDGGRAS
ncbi:DUF397 domain-containing protein [Dactylosporangium sp. NPDC005572]|uniref:DUF397 domain-containing protein n=1 Tax=Dactylosporangium sp. NPDC005572 TaxID=3156889 RepID=UPI0033B72D0B